MPELPEVERARKLIDTTLRGYRIVGVETWDDPIVYTGGITHGEFVSRGVVWFGLVVVEVGVDVCVLRIGGRD